MVHLLSFLVGIVMGYSHGRLMYMSVLGDERSNVVLFACIRYGLLLALLMGVHHTMGLNLIWWSFGFFPSLWYHAVAKLREKPDEIRNF